MPTSAFSAFWESDPRRWQRCRQQAATAMVAEGWHPQARKFQEVQTRRALRLWRSA